MVPGQLALACIWSRFLRCHTPIVLNCSLPQIRGWLHCPNPTTTPRCLFVGRMNTSCSMKKKKSLKHTWAALESPAGSDADRMFPFQPLPGLPPWACFSEVDLKWRRHFQEAGLITPPEGELSGEETPRDFNWLLSCGLFFPGGSSRSWALAWGLIWSKHRLRTCDKMRWP